MGIEEGSEPSPIPINEELEDNLLASPSADVGGSSGKKPEDETTPMEVTEKIEELRLQPQRISGAQRRTMAIHRAKQRGEPILKRTRKARQNPNVNLRTPAPGQTTGSVDPKKPGPTPTKSGKRGRSLGSTPSSSGSAPRTCPKKSKTGGGGVERVIHPNMVGGEDSETYQQALKALKMAVVLEEYSEKELPTDQGRTVQWAILAEVWKSKNSQGPQFRNGYVEKGAVLITCENQSAKDWLMATVPTIHPWEGANLRVGPYREIIKTTRVAM
ncbi:uncharacterized protein LOC112127472 [Cimex lectularius]|uniref:DUF4780 domain-containing protein n=1 Tax=Cimex lectularius TaxID=79782 RepID=A0A8I6SM78_CIMLE|nr:uncharacterized protein LOC112127472 [Cimex lectularius]